MPRSLAHSLILKIGAVMLVIEVIAFTITGAYFVRRFSEQVDQRVAERMRIPGMLISQRLLSYESVTDAATRTRVRPNSTRTDPSAWSSQPRVNFT